MTDFSSIKMNSLRSLLCLCSIIFTTALHLNSDFKNSVRLDPKYLLHWNIDRVEKTIFFGVEAKTTGWIGLGISKEFSGKKFDINLMVAWINADGKAILKDCHITRNGNSALDMKQDLQLIDARKSSKWIMFRFKRRLETCDDSMLEVLYAWGASLPAEYSCSSLLEASSNWRLKKINLLSHWGNTKIPPGTKFFDLKTKEIQVPAKKTTYWCTSLMVQDFVKLDGEKHIFMLKPIIEEGNGRRIHHMSLYVCKDNFNPAHLHYSGECWNKQVPSSVRECHGMSAIYSWGRGGKGFVFPENVGWPVGGKDGMKYVVLETHLNNPKEERGNKVLSGFRLYYGEPRKYTASMLALTVDESSIAIPPHMNEWTLKGVCTKGCTEKIRGKENSNPTESIKLIGVLLHAHSNAVRLRTALVRNGEEIKEIAKVDDYSYLKQKMAILDEEVEIRPGDEINLYCTYNTTKKDAVTFGGMGSDEEMCFNFILYYPKTNLSYCGSDAIYQSFQKAPSQRFDTAKSLPENQKKVLVNRRTSIYDATADVKQYCYGLDSIDYRLPHTKVPILVKDRTRNNKCSKRKFGRRKRRNRMRNHDSNSKYIYRN